jgi:hypothetical protein
MIVFDDLPLFMPDVFGNNAIPVKEQPLHKIIESFTFVGGGVDCFPKFHIVDIFEQEYSPNGSAQFPECVIQIVLTAGCLVVKQRGTIAKESG